ncbi:MAG: hypothetical protein ABIZ34_04835 [Candidatus Limnocylindrales bacterium]
MKRPAGMLLGASLFIAAFAAPALAGPVDCALSVTPAQGPPGTEFVFAGAGYTPTRLTLHQSGAEARVSELDLHGADPFEIRLIATDEDAGRWRATASIPATECAGEVMFKVTLPPTATIDLAVDDSRGLSRTANLLGLSALISVFLFAAWHFGGRFAHRP